MLGTPAKKSSEKTLAAIDTLIGSGFELTGNIAFSGALRIDGKVDGNIASRDAENGALVVGEGGEVRGDLNVAHAIVNGRIKGNVHCSESIELQPQAEIVGDVHYKAIVIAPGAIVCGKLTCTTGHEKGVVSRPKPGATPQD